MTFVRTTRLHICLLLHKNPSGFSLANIFIVIMVRLEASTMTHNEGCVHTIKPANLLVKKDLYANIMTLGSVK